MTAMEGKVAMAYERNEKLFVSSMCKTKRNLWIGVEPIYEMDKNDPERIGKVIRECLRLSKTDVPDPEDYNEVFKPMLKISGAKSYRDFAKTAKFISVSLDNNKIKLNPHKRDKKGNYFPMAIITEIFANSDKDLCKAVLSAISQTE